MKDVFAARESSSFGSKPYKSMTIHLSSTWTLFFGSYARHYTPLHKWVVFHRHFVGKDTSRVETREVQTWYLDWCILDPLQSNQNLFMFAMSGHYSSLSAGIRPVSVGWNNSKAKSPRPGERRNSKGQNISPGTKTTLKLRWLGMDSGEKSCFPSCNLYPT